MEEPLSRYNAKLSTSRQQTIAPYRMGWKAFKTLLEKYDQLHETEL